jgi:hypothetical protein
MREAGNRVQEGMRRNAVKVAAKVTGFFSKSCLDSMSTPIGSPLLTWNRPDFFTDPPFTLNDILSPLAVVK